MQDPARVAIYPTLSLFFSDCQRDLCADNKAGDTNYTNHRDVFICLVKFPNQKSAFIPLKGVTTTDRNTMRWLQLLLWPSKRHWYLFVLHCPSSSPLIHSLFVEDLSYAGYCPRFRRQYLHLGPEECDSRLSTVASIIPSAPEDFVMGCYWQ